MINFNKIDFKILFSIFSTIYFVGLMGGFISMNEALGGLNFSPILFPIYFSLISIVILIICYLLIFMYVYFLEKELRVYLLRFFGRV